MGISEKDLDLLVRLQEVDLEIMRAAKKLEELPQRQKIMELRKKKKDVEEKQSKILEMKKTAQMSLTRLNDEDERLIQKQTDIQAKIDSANGDYRSIEAFTKELNGIAKRRTSLEIDFTPISERIDQIEELEKQVTQALGLVIENENQVIESFKKEGGVLKNQVARLETAKKSLVDEFDGDYYALYTKHYDRCGGVAISHLKGRECSVCRNTLEDGRYLIARSEAPLSECPFCRRMMVVVDE